jgi:hypothetical protein
MHSRMYRQRLAQKLADGALDVVGSTAVCADYF